MHTLVRPVTKRLQAVLSRFWTPPDLCHISFSTFAMELTKLNDRIAELVAESDQRGTPMDKIQRLALQADISFSEAECDELIQAIQSHFKVSLTTNDRRLIKKRGYTLVAIFSRFQRRAKMQSDPKIRPLRAAA